MKCQNCGRELKNGARFCIGCGAQHDSNGQLISGNQGKVDYNKTVMSNDLPRSNGGNVDYNKTMMAGSTGFKQYQPEQSVQNYQSYNYQNAAQSASANGNVSSSAPAKKKLSPIMIICPIVIIVALLFSFLNGKKSNKTAKVAESVQVETTVAVATVSETAPSEEKPIVHLEGYWSADADYFYINGEMQKNMWIDDTYYVGDDGKKVTNDWVDNKYYVDATGKKARNEWIEFTFYGEDGQKKIGFYYVGKDGLRVYDETIDGRYVNEEGCYWPTMGEVMKKDEKKNQVKSDELKEEETTTETAKETTKMVETTAPIVTTTQYIPPTTRANQVVTQNIAPAAASVVDVPSDGKSIAYQLLTETIPNEKITKYVNIIITDVKNTSLVASVNGWNMNRSRAGISSGQIIVDNNYTMTYDIKVERNDGKVFSLCETITKLENGREYDKRTQGYNWDAKTGELLSIESIFTDEEKYNEFNKKMVNRIKANKSSFDEDVYNELIGDNPENIHEYSTWYMTNTGISLLFNSDDIGSNRITGVTTALTYTDTVNKLLLSKYKK